MLNGLNSLRLSLMSFKHKKGKENVIADALSRRYTMFHNMTSKYLVWRPSKINMCMMLNLKMYSS